MTFDTILWTVYYRYAVFTVSLPDDHLVRMYYESRSTCRYITIHMHGEREFVLTRHPPIYRGAAHVNLPRIYYQVARAPRSQETIVCRKRQARTVDRALLFWGQSALPYCYCSIPERLQHGWLHKSFLCPRKHNMNRLGLMPDRYELVYRTYKPLRNTTYLLTWKQAGLHGVGLG